MRNVVIAIQARSTSQRLPNKALKMLAGKPALQWVLDPCKYVSVYMRMDVQRLEAKISVCLVVPKGDPITNIFQNMVEIIEGDESDVLSRYVKAQGHYNADYVVRVTGDCVFIPPHVVARHVKAALIMEKDYTTNTHYRTYKEGFDCEVISKRLLAWLTEHARSPEDREHVTTLIAKGRSFPFHDPDGKPSMCHILNTVDESPIKTSIDTQEEFDAAEEAILRFRRVKNEAWRAGTVRA